MQVCLNSGRVSQAQVTEDYYATLGVAPRSEAAEIRAAYLALMRLYHPDKNDSPAAIERALAIIAAFAVLGDIEKRLHYDWGRRRAAEAAAQPPRWQFGKLPWGLIGAALVVLLLMSLSFIRFPVTVRDRPVAPPAAVAEAEPRPPQIENMAGSAAPLAAPAPIVAPKPAAVVEPVAAEPAPPQPRLRAEALPLAPPSPRMALAPRERQPARKAITSNVPPASASAKCRSVRPGAEAAICNNNSLTALDRNVVEFYNQSLMYGAETNRGALLDSRNSFLARREACRSDTCLQSVHLGHLRELSAIVEKRPPDPPR